MSFPLSEKIKPRTVFLAKSSELRDRFDPEMVLFRRKTHYFSYPPQRLRDLLSEPPQYGAGEPGIERQDPSSPRYVRITDINEYGELSSDLGATAGTIEDRYFLEDSDLLLARSGNTVGKSYLHHANLQSYKCFYAGYLIRFKLNRDAVIPDYVFAITQLPYFRQWVAAVKRPAGQPNINAVEYSNLQVPVPPTKIQEKVVEQLHVAYEQKRAKEKKARELLTKIDDVLLSELGIPNVPVLPSIIENRIFLSSIHGLTCQRWDPLYHQGDIFYFIRDAKYDLHELGEKAVYFLTGFAAGRTDQSDEKDGIIQIRPTNIIEDRELVFNRNVYIAASKLGERKIDVLKSGEVLFNNTNSQEQVGKTVFFDLEGDYFCSNHITRIATKSEELDPQYLSYVLNLYQRKKVFFKLCTNWNNQSGVGVDILQRIPIPVPSSKRQAAVVVHLEKIRTDARELCRQAVDELDKAKQQIETLILGKRAIA